VHLGAGERFPEDFVRAGGGSMGRDSVTFLKSDLRENAGRDSEGDEPFLPIGNTRA